MTVQHWCSVIIFSMGTDLHDLLMNARRRTAGATVFAYEVADPQRYGVISFHADGEPIAIDEKPKNPRSNPPIGANSRLPTLISAIWSRVGCTSKEWVEGSLG
jgi:ADP-glucose pyrophosphorylase